MPLNSNALTTLAAVKTELSITDTSSDTTLEDLINATSSAIESFLDRTLQLAVGIVELVAGYGSFKIILKRTPVKVLTDVTMVSGSGVDAILDVTSITIDNPTAGFLYRRAGWVSTAPRPPGSAGRDAFMGQEEKSIQVTYDGGFVLPNDIGVVDLPVDIQRAAVLDVTQQFRQLGRDRDITAEKLKSWSATYGGAGNSGASSPFSVIVERLLLPHRKIRCA